MRKLCAVILSAVVWLVAAGTPASAAEHQSTLSAGYLQTHTDMPGSDDTPASAAEHQSTLSAGYLQTHTDMPGSDD
ncbi:Ail/Lom family outer membrane beta-barrel protein, partial [Escherichia coli]|uniref:Ail/Lom family outer membrane beta-barrel protein n=1 Tax=Escherichia coli TaxID=562 RepID=UPI002022DC50